MASRGQSLRVGDDVTLSYIEQGDPAGTTLVLVPGLGDSWRSYEPVIEHLPSSIRVLAVSQRGHGDSSRPVSGYRFMDFVTDLRAFMEALDVESAVLGGHSSHGLVVEKFAIDYPDQVLGLALIGTPVTLRGNGAATAFLESTISQLRDPLDIHFIRSFAQSTLVQEVPQAFIDVIWEETSKVPARVFKEFFKDLLQTDFSSDLSKIDSPALLVWGDRDAILSRADQETLASALPNSRLVVYPGAGHSPHWEQPEHFASDLVSFIEGLQEFEVVP